MMYGNEFLKDLHMVKKSDMLNAQKYRATIEILRYALEWREQEFCKFSDEIDAQAIIQLNQALVTVAQEVIRHDDLLAKELRKLADIFEGK